MTAIARTTALPEATPVGALSAQLRRPRSRSAMSGVHRLRPAGIRERRPLAGGMAKRSLAVRKLSRFAVGTSISGRPYREPPRIWHPMRLCPPSGGDVASQSECSIGCSAIAVVQGCCLFSRPSHGASKIRISRHSYGYCDQLGACSGPENRSPAFGTKVECHSSTAICSTRVSFDEALS